MLTHADEKCAEMQAELDGLKKEKKKDESVKKKIQQVRPFVCIGAPLCVCVCVCVHVCVYTYIYDLYMYI